MLRLIFLSFSIEHNALTITDVQKFEKQKLNFAQ